MLHFWNASERLFISQSSLSRQIQSLERDLGFILFERDKRNVKLTPAGLFLKEQWQPILDEIEKSRRQAKRIAQNKTGHVVLSYPGSIAFRFLPALVEAVRNDLPNLRIELIEPQDDDHIHLLLDFKIDLAFSRDTFEHSHIASTQLFSENICLVVYEDHWLTAEKFTRLAQLQEENFILSGLHHETQFALTLRRLFAENHFEPQSIVASDFGGMIMAMVAKGLGISILPASFKYANYPKIRFIDLPQRVALYVNYRKQEQNQSVLDIIRKAQYIGDDLYETQ